MKMLLLEFDKVYPWGRTEGLRWQILLYAVKSEQIANAGNAIR
jgi:hypothetical protein